MSLVIFSLANGRLRRVIKDAVLSDADLLLIHPPGPGEGSAINVTQEGLEDIQEEITLRTGLVPSDDRYVMVNPAGGVTGAIVADPAAGDSVDGLTLHAHPEAGPGWRLMLDLVTFQRSINLINADIQRVEAEIFHLNSDVWTANRQEEGLNPGQINSLRISLLNDANGRLSDFEDERTVRQGPRT